MLGRPYRVFESQTWDWTETSIFVKVEVPQHSFNEIVKVVQEMMKTHSNSKWTNRNLGKFS